MEQTVIERLLDVPMPLEVKHIILIALALLIAIDKIKAIPFQPVQRVLGALGKAMNRELTDKVQTMDDALSQHIDAQNKSEARRLRAGILSFANSIREGKHHTKDQYENIFRDNDDYLNICDECRIDNGYEEREMEYICECYKTEYGKPPKSKGEKR